MQFQKGALLTSPGSPQILGNLLTLFVRNIWSEGLISNTINLSFEKQFIQQTFIKVFICQKLCYGDAKMDQVPFPALKELTF